MNEAILVIYFPPTWPLRECWQWVLAEDEKAVSLGFRNYMNDQPKIKVRTASVKLKTLPPYQAGWGPGMRPPQ